MVRKSKTSGTATSVPPRTKYTPLSIVALFFGLVEALLTYSSSQTDGYLQLVILSFMALFATGIAIAFFLVLWHRNWVFYPPSEFSSPSVQTYVKAMRVDGPQISEVAADGISKALSAEALVKKLDLTEVPESERRLRIEQVIDEVRNEAIANVGESVIHVDARPLKGRSAPQWEEPYTEKLTIEALLNRVWLRLQPFPPYEYGTVWILKDAHSDTVFDDVGPSWRNQSRARADERSLSDVGIRGGMHLEVVAKS